MYQNKHHAQASKEPSITGWALFVAFAVLFLVFELIWGSANTELSLMGLRLANWRQGRQYYVSVIQIIAIIGTFLFSSKGKNILALVCSIFHAVLTVTMTIGILAYPNMQVPPLALLSYLLYLIASSALILFTLGKAQKHIKLLAWLLFSFAILSVLFSVILSFFMFPNGNFVGSIFWSSGIKRALFFTQMAIQNLGGSGAIYWPIGRCFFFFLLFVAFRNIYYQPPAKTQKYSAAFETDTLKISLKGVNGQLYIFEDKVVIERKGILGFLLIGLAGSKTIPMNSIMSVQFKEGTSITNGFIQFGILGGKENRSGLFSATRDENTVMLNKKYNATARRIKEYIEQKIMERNQSPEIVVAQQNSAADEIAKFKSLLDQGVITQDEFDAKKKQLLGL